MTPDTDLIEDYLDHLSTLRSAKTARSYGRTVQVAHRELPHGLPCASPPELQAWLARYANPSTQRTYVSGLRHFAGWAVETGRLKGNAAAKVRRAPQPPSLPNPCEDAELAAILAGAPEPYRTWSLIAAYGGARCVEISRLQREQITAERMQLFGKRDKLRSVPTHELVWEAQIIRDEQAAHEPGDPDLVGDPLVSRTIYALRDLRVQGPATAEEVLTVVGWRRWLRIGQHAAVLAAFAPQPRLRPQGPADPAQTRADADSEPGR